MSQEPHDLDQFEIFYEEVGNASYTDSLEYDEPPVFLEEVELTPSQGLNAEDLPLLSQDLDTPNRFDPHEEEIKNFE